MRDDNVCISIACYNDIQRDIANHTVRSCKLQAIVEFMSVIKCR